MKQLAVLPALLVALSVSGGVSAADPQPAPEKAQAKTQKQEIIYGSQIMTLAERNQYRAKMRAAKTVEEREQIRKEHHEAMKVRAAERGLTLPDEPPARGVGMGPGGGGGMGPGGGGKGMGPGGGGMGPGGGGMGPGGGRAR